MVSNRDNAPWTVVSSTGEGLYCDTPFPAGKIEPGGAFATYKVLSYPFLANASFMDSQGKTLGFSLGMKEKGGQVYTS